MKWKKSLQSKNYVMRLQWFDDCRIGTLTLNSLNQHLTECIYTGTKTICLHYHQWLAADEVCSYILLLLVMYACLGRQLVFSTQVTCSVHRNVCGDAERCSSLHVLMLYKKRPELNHVKLAVLFSPHA